MKLLIMNFGTLHVSHPLHSSSRAGDVGLGVFRSEEGIGVGDEDHPDVYREGDVLP